MSLDLFVHHFSNTYSPSIVSLFQPSRLWDTNSPLGPVNSLLVTQCRGSEWVLTFVLFCFFLFFFLLYNMVLVLPYINMNSPWVYMRSPSWTPLPRPFPSHPSGSSQYTSPKHPVSCIEPGLAICFTYDIIPFDTILPNHPTLSLSLSHRVQKTVLYICVSFAASHTGLSLPSF